ncbi:MAG: acyltransferase [Nevskia sp.]|jgi:1-acyl-sn-glycerol-3-phosphate acyltransferase|nr:acyltransferase [Nevskia sp.]MCK9385321.1 acyltransferase [Nevskia sp.]
MLRFMPAWFTGTVMALLLLLNTIFWVTPLYFFAVVKLLPIAGLRLFCSRIIAACGQNWASVNTWFGDQLLPTRWQIRGVEKLDPRGQYLVCCNHQTWNDIYVVMKAFDRRAPFFKFFLKQELIWVPLLGLAWWGLDYPFMKRYSAAYLARHPEARGNDLITTRKACERYRNLPVTILNFLEGTRFSKAKQAKQKSPYRHLLRPRAGGFALAISAMGEKINLLLDVTVVYPEGARGFWGLLSGQVQNVIVEVRQVTIPHEMYVGSYEQDPQFRKRFQAWIAEIWQVKDQRIAELLAESGVQP